MPVNLSFFIKYFLKMILTFHGIASSSRKPGIYFLNYHRVTGNLALELDIPYDCFFRQIKYLIRNKKIVSYDAAVEILQSNEAPGSNLYVLTFDDGFLDFYTRVFPLLKKYEINATLFAATAFIDEGRPLPLSKLPNHSEKIKPVSWEMLREMHHSGLVTIGCHTHNHFDLPTIPDARIEEELSGALDMLKNMAGVDARHFAYPRGRWDARSESVVKQFFDTAAIVDGRIVLSSKYDRYRISRMPIQKSDRWIFFISKVNGYLRNEQEFYKKVRPDFLSR